MIEQRAPDAKERIPALLHELARVKKSTSVYDDVCNYVEFFEDFFPDASATLPKPLGTQDTSVTGAPVIDYVADAADGHYVVQAGADTDAFKTTLYFADQLVIPAAKLTAFEVMLKIESDVTGAGGLFAASDKFVVGVASARNATLDSVVTHAWFMAAGANHNLYCESDDSVTDKDDIDSLVDWAEDSFMRLVIDFENKSDVQFFADVDGNGLVRLAPGTTFDWDQATGNLQFFLELQKASAANKDHKITTDYVRIIWQRTALG
jgi:hypothetical protein